MTLLYEVEEEDDLEDEKPRKENLHQQHLVVVSPIYSIILRRP